MKQLKNSESGQALILVLIMLAFGSLVVVPTLDLAATSTKYHQVVKENTLETYAADSGVEYALCKVGNDKEAYEQTPLQHSFEMNGRTIDVTAEYMGANVFRINSTATVISNNSNTSVESYVTMTSSLFDYGMAALDGYINLSGNAEVSSTFDCEIYSNGQIIMSGNAEVQGDAFATGDVTVDGNAYISGNTTENTGTPLVFGGIDTSVYIAEADQGTLIEGNLNITGSGYYDLGPAHITGNLVIQDNRIVRLQGTVYVDGTITVSGNARIEGGATIVAVGDITVSGNTELTAEDIPLVISTNGGITVSGNGCTSAILYAPSGTITLSGNSNVYGAVVAQSINAMGNNVLEYATGLKGRSDLPGAGGLNIVSYNTNK